MVQDASFIQCGPESLGPTGLNALIQCADFGRLDGSHHPTALPLGQPVSNDTWDMAAW